MASAISHTVAALSFGTCFYRPQIPKKVGASANIEPNLTRMKLLKKTAILCPTSPVMMEPKNESRSDNLHWLRGLTHPDARTLALSSQPPRLNRPRPEDSSASPAT